MRHAIKNRFTYAQLACHNFNTAANAEPPPVGHRYRQALRLVTLGENTMHTTAYTTAPRTAAQLHAEIVAAAAVAPEWQNNEAATWLHGARPVINSRRDFYFDGLATDISEHRKAGAMAKVRQCEWLEDTTDADTISELLHWADRTPRHLTFKTATGRVKLVNTAERLQGFADAMAKSKAAWQLWGGGNMPAELAKPKKANHIGKRVCATV